MNRRQGHAARVEWLNRFPDTWKHYQFGPRSQTKRILFQMMQQCGLYSPSTVWSDSGLDRLIANLRKIDPSPMSTLSPKPCPFCGQPAESDRWRGFWDSRGMNRHAVAIYCSSCDAEMALCHDDHPEYSADELLEILTHRWNMRTP